MNSKLYKLAKLVLQLAEMETDKGVLISDAEIEVGREVFVEDENGELVAAPDGEYKESNGERIFVVVDGRVAEIREPEIEEAPAEPEPTEIQEEEETPEPETEEPIEDEKDKRIAELEAQIEELNNIIVEKDTEIGKLKAELERSDAEPAEEQLKSQKEENKSWFKPRF